MASSTHTPRGTVHDYARGVETFRICTADDITFIIDKSTLSLISPIFRTMLADVSDPNEMLSVQDPGRSWKLLLDVAHRPWDLSKSTLSDMESSIHICRRYEMVVIESTLLQQVMRQIGNDREGVLRVLTQLQHPITVYLKRWEEWELSVNGGWVDLSSSVATHLEYFDRQYPSRQHERVKASTQAVIDLMASYDQTGCFSKNHGWGAGKMAHNAWKDATTWMRRQILQRKLTTAEDVLDDCQERFGIIDGCKLCTKRMQLAFAYVRRKGKADGHI